MVMLDRDEDAAGRAELELALDPHGKSAKSGSHTFANSANGNEKLNAAFWTCSATRQDR